MIKSILGVAALASAVCAQTTCFNFEGAACHPIRVSADGARLFTVSTVDHRLTVWSLAHPRNPVILAEIPVGLQPVSVTERTPDEVWVVDNLSDAISVVSLSRRQVIATIHVGDEPADVVFAQGKAFVSVAAEDRIKVYDAQSRGFLGEVEVFGKDPRALAVRSDGARVFALVQRSGNGTTIIPENSAPPPPPPSNPLLPPAPSQSLIARADDPAWSQVVGYTVPDFDLVEIDVASATIVRNIAAIGTNNFDVVVDAAGVTAYVVNTDARNLVRFEPVLRGHCIDSRITKVTLAGPATVTPIDLNPGIQYATLPDPVASSTALAEPMAVALDEVRAELYVAAHGSDRIGVTDLAGNVLARIDLQGSSVTGEKRGPRGIALHPTRAELYVYNRLSKTIAVVDRQTRAVVGEKSFTTWDPESDDIAVGRRFLYDTKLSGNGTMSCASCHIDGDMDGIAWDLGDPGGAMQSPPANQPIPFSLQLGQWHPMKGPMTTQTLKGLQGTEPLHWRGDRPDFQAFNRAFNVLMGGNQLAAADMDRFAAFGTSITYPPNPNQPLDRTLSATPAGANQAAGFGAFTGFTVNFFIGGYSVQAQCATCHELPDGTSSLVVSGPAMALVQDMKVAQVRNVYRKLGFDRTPGNASKAGFGFSNDGSIDTLASFLNQPQFGQWPVSIRDDIAAYLVAFDTGTAPLVGFRRVMDSSNQADVLLLADLNTMKVRAGQGDIDLIAEGMIGGHPAGFRYDPAGQTWAADRTGLGPLTQTQLESLLLQGGATVAFTGVMPNEGVRVALDRDEDGRLDGDEATSVYGPPTPGATTPSIFSNSEPRIGNRAFAVVGTGGPSSVLGFLLYGQTRINQPLLGSTLLVNAFDGGSSGVLFLFADSRGTLLLPLPLPDAPGLVGTPLNFQFAWTDPQGPGGFSATSGLAMVVRP